MEALQHMLPGALLVFCRILSYFSVMPLISSRNIPNLWKIGMAAMLAFITLPTLETAQGPAFDDGYIVLLLKEIVVGLALGFVGLLFFSAIQASGSFIDMQIGFGIANIVDPMTGQQTPLIGQLKYMIALVLMLAVNAHHIVISAIIESYRWIPLESADFYSVWAKGNPADFLVRGLADMFAISFKLAAPLVVAVFLVDLALGILAKTAPQFNVFVLGIPIKILVALLLLMVLMSSFIGLFTELYGTIFENMRRFLDLFATGSS
ncbi:flagellar type III secretion system protein FliR [Paenibacillus thermoaerophilus]|nr:flagellar type III secretion system protein FliR [Paenibacillus thermoaerophilus]